MHHFTTKPLHHEQRNLPGPTQTDVPHAVCIMLLNAVCIMPMDAVCIMLLLPPAVTVDSPCAGGGGGSQHTVGRSGLASWHPAHRVTASIAKVYMARIRGLCSRLQGCHGIVKAGLGPRYAWPV
jgi:hypothetical protein